MPPMAGFFCASPGARRAYAEAPLSGIGKPGSGTEPIHQEHVKCSRFRGSCPSDVKSAVHPESGFPIPLSGDSAALCAPREAQKNPAIGSIPGYLSSPQPPIKSSGHTQTRGRTVWYRLEVLVFNAVSGSIFLAVPVLLRSARCAEDNRSGPVHGYISVGWSWFQDLISAWETCAPYRAFFPSCG